MEDNDWVIYDGKLIKADQPVIAVESRGLMYGDGCFETFRLYEGRFFKIDAHLNRLQSGAEFLSMDYPSDLTVPSLKKMIARLVRHNEITNKDAIVRVQIWREGQRGYRIQGSSKSHYSILTTPLTGLQAPLSLATVDIKRIPNEALPSGFKLSNNINYIVAAHQAREKSADDALMQTVDGFISETTIANLFWGSGSKVFTPSEKCDLLPGITRNVLIHLVEKSDKLEIEMGMFRPEDIFNAEAVWICNSIRELVPVTRIDTHRYSTDHPILNELKAAFKEYLKRKLTN